MPALELPCSELDRLGVHEALAPRRFEPVSELAGSGADFQNSPNRHVALEGTIDDAPRKLRIRLARSARLEQLTNHRLILKRRLGFFLLATPGHVQHSAGERRHRMPL